MKSQQTDGINARVGKYIKHLRIYQNLTLKDLAKKVGSNYVYLSKIERNKSEIKVGLLQKIAISLNVDICDFDVDPTETDKINKLLMETLGSRGMKDNLFRELDYLTPRFKKDLMNILLKGKLP